MATFFTGKSGTQYIIIEPALGKGGEGTVYAINGDKEHVLKVYHASNQTTSREKKLLVMVNNPISASAMQQVAWPTDVVYDNGKFVGFVMPRASDIEELNVMYSDKYICTLSERITMAKNICVAIHAVHEAGQVCGDLNPKNIAVNVGQGTVMLVDTDSYHISDGNREYRCEVGMPPYISPEVQIKMSNGMTLKNAPLPTYTKESDRFALAVHIFALLMNSCHPFACAVDLSLRQRSVAAPQPVDNIRDGIFPFVQKQSGITIPAYAPDFDYLPEEIKKLFIRAFVDGHKQPSKRPSAEEWFYALDKMSKTLKVCTKDIHHMYPSSCTSCPWCDLQTKMSSVQTKVTQTTQVTGYTRSNNNYPPFYGNATPPQHTPPQQVITNTGTHSNKNKKWVVIAVLAAIIALIAITSGGGVNKRSDLPVSATKLTKQSAQKANYRFRENPEFFLRADESCTPVIINLDGKYTNFHFGYYLDNIYGDEGGMRFMVYADGNTVLDTGYLWPGTEATPSYYPYNIDYEDLNVTGVSQLELRADYNGASDPYDTTRRVMIVNAFAYNKDWNICVFDEARVLNQEEQEKLEVYAHEIREKYGIDFMFITTSDPQGVNLQSFGENYYNNYRTGYYSDRIIVVAYFDGELVGGGYATQVCSKCDLFFYGSSANSIQSNRLSGQGLQYFWNSIDSQKYYSAFTNAIYETEEYLK